MVMQPTIQVASLGFENSIILMVLALVVFGPRRLPEIGRRIGKIMYEIRKASNDFKFQMEEELRTAEEAERRKKEEERLSEQASSEPAVAASPLPQAASATPAESPYPNGAVYPPVVAATSEEPYPRIFPPSTGKQVPAARPGKRPAQAKSMAAKKSARTTKGKPAATKTPARVKKTSKTPGRSS
jgi:sec-independent protein translocase protein TatB